MRHTKIAEVLQSDQFSKEYTVKGWVRSFRSNRFVILNDGSALNSLQCVIDFDNTDDQTLSEINVGAALAITGVLQESEGRGQRVEIKVRKTEILGQVNPEEVKKTILSPKRHSLEKLREQAHLRARTNTFGAIMRIRSKLAYAVHDYFQKNDFHYVNTPIITGSDAEGAGEMFKVTNFDLADIPKTPKGKVDLSQDFFGQSHQSNRERTTRS